MIIIMERGATKVQIQKVIDLLKDNGFDIRLNQGQVHTVIDAIGDKTTVTPGRVSAGTSGTVQERRNFHSD